MNTYFFRIVLLLTIGIWVSCQPKIVTDVEVPNVKPKLVLFCFLSPEDSMIEVEVTMSAPIFGNTINTGNLTVSNAYVQISDGAKSVNIPYFTDERKYSISQAIYSLIAGETYTITATANGLTAIGETTIPKSKVYMEKASAKLITTSTSGQNQLLFTLLWKDEPIEKNYYRVHLDKLYYSSWKGDSTASSIGDGMFQDKNKDGTSFSDQYEYNYYEGSGSPENVYVYLLNTDIHYYEYHRRRLVYFGDDPFSEPFQQYSNVEGGLGVVSSFRKTRVVITY